MTTAFIILPDFLPILLGFARSRWLRYERGSWDALERLIYFMLFPVLLFRSLLRTTIELTAAAPLIATGLGIMFAGMLLSYLAKSISSLRVPAFSHPVFSAVFASIHILGWPSPAHCTERKVLPPWRSWQGL
jgi:malonate transporter